MKRQPWLLLLGIALLPAVSAADSGSRLVASGGITSFEGTAGGGITPWAFIAGYGSRDQINGAVNIQTLDVGDYRLDTFGTSVGFYDRFELSLQRQSLDVSAGVVSSVFSLLTDGQISQAPGTEIEQDIIGIKVKVWGDAIFAASSWQPQISLGAQYKNNRDFDTSLFTVDGAVPLPGMGVPKILGARDDSGVDYYVSATKLWLGGAFGSNLLLNGTVRYTKANTFGLLGFGSANDDDYDLEFEGSVAVLPNPDTAIGIEWRTQSDRLGGLAEEKTVTDVFIAYFPSKAWSITAAYVDLGSLPFEQDAKGFYLTVTANL